MNSFKLLHFLNTADPEALTSLPGVGSALAERICAARPFVSLEDCCRVRGITLSFIHRLEAVMPDPEPESPLEIITIETEEKLTVPEDVPAAAPLPPPSGKPSAKPASGSGFWSGFGRFLKGLLFFLLRLIVILLLLAGIAVGIAYLGPLAYERYIRPVEMNVAQVAALETQQAQSAAQIASLQARLATAEAALGKQAETITGLAGRIQTAEEGIARHTKQLAALDEIQAEYLKNNDASLTRIDGQIRLLKAMEMLSRARLFLYQSNFGLAKQDAQSARDLLAGLQEDAPEALAAELTEALFRLDLVLKNLPDFPVAASVDLDLAWQVLVQGIPQPTPVPTESATPSPLPGTPIPEIPTPEPPTPDLSATPAPTATP
jgi:uncharacterized coiled-coil protein SlyX